MTDHLDLDPTQQALLRTWRELDTQAKSYAQAASVIRSRLEEALGEREEAWVDGRPVVRYAWTQPRHSIDVKRLREEMPDVAEKFTRTGEPTRRWQVVDE